jgi:hypothetical protein
MDSSRLQPALVGCCLWVISGGALAFYLRQQNSSESLTSAEGAYLGFLAGLIGGVLGAILSIPIDMMMGPFQRRLMESVMSMNPDMPSEIREMSQRAGTGPLAVLFKLVLGVVTGAVFGMIGGLLGVALFKKNMPPAPGRVDILPPE